MNFFCESDTHRGESHRGRGLARQRKKPRYRPHAATEAKYLFALLGRINAECQHKFVQFMVYKCQFLVSSGRAFEPSIPRRMDPAENEWLAVFPKRKRYQAHPQLGSVFSILLSVF
jgi:hypothetical protein